MQNIVRPIVALGSLILAAVALVLALVGVPLVFRLVTFAAFAAAVLMAVNFVDTLATFAAAHERSARATARLSGEGLVLNQRITEAGAQTTARFFRFLALLFGGVALVFALTGVPAIPLGSLVALFITVLPIGCLSFFFVLAHFGVERLNEIADKADEVERVHAGVRDLANRLSAEIGEEAESGLAIATALLLEAVKVVAKHPDAVSFEVSFQGITENPEGINFGVQPWVRDIIKILDAQPLERARIWVDQLLAATDDFAKVAQTGGDFSFEFKLPE